MNTKQAFQKLLKTQDLLDKLGATQEAIRKWRQRFNEGILPEKKQIELLKKVATRTKKVKYIKVQEDVWKFKI